MGALAARPSLKELSLSNWTRFKCKTGEFLYAWDRSEKAWLGLIFGLCLTHVQPEGGTELGVSPREVRPLPVRTPLISAA